MVMKGKRSKLFQQAIEKVKKLSLEEQEELLSLLQEEIYKKHNQIISQNKIENNRELGAKKVEYGSMDGFEEEIG